MLFKNSTSAESLELPWRKLKARRPVVVPQNQTGKLVGTVGFYLCFMSTLVMVCGIILLSLCIWSLVKRNFFVYIIKLPPADVEFFAIPAGLLCFPSFWIAASIHTRQRKYKYLPLLLTFLTISLILLLISTYILFSQKNKYEAIAHQMSISNTTVQNEVINSMEETALKYKKNENYHRAWDILQNRHQCCGIRNYTDWMDITGYIPNSCCPHVLCLQPHTKNCVKSVVRDLLRMKHLLGSMLCIAGSMQELSVITKLSLYYHEMKYVDGDELEEAPNRGGSKN